jgi:hypothetical protein
MPMFATRHGRHVRPAGSARPANSARPAGSARPANSARPARHARPATPRRHVRYVRRAAGLLSLGAVLIGLQACSPGAPLPDPGPIASQQAVAARAQQASSVTQGTAGHRAR